MNYLKKNKNLIYFLIASCLFLLIVLHNELEESWNIYILMSPSKINACIFILVRNSHLGALTRTIQLFELQFNHKHNYPYVLMNHEAFTNEFKSEIVKHTNSLVEFGQIDEEHWKVPDWINQTEMNHQFETSLKDVGGGNILSYHHMCRYYSGFFFRHELTLKYDYYWRLDHHLDFPCQINDDPFEVLARDKKLYGFGLLVEEQMTSCPTLWPTLNKWLDENSNIKNQIPKSNSIEYISDDKKSLINTCIFFNNFEVSSFSIFRDEKYLNFFDYLDKAGGFYYERWGDAPVHSYYVMLMLSKHDVIRFDKIGYGHNVHYSHPADKSINCTYAKGKNYVFNLDSACTKKWYKLYAKDS